MTNHQRAVLAHVVIDPDAWLANATSTLGPAFAAEALEQKVARWQPEYLVASANPAYASRAGREVMGGA